VSKPLEPQEQELMGMDVRGSAATMKPEEFKGSENLPSILKN